MISGEWADLVDRHAYLGEDLERITSLHRVSRFDSSSTVPILGTIDFSPLPGDVVPFSLDETDDLRSFLSLPSPWAFCSKEGSEYGCLGVVERGCVRPDGDRLIAHPSVRFILRCVVAAKVVRVRGAEGMHGEEGGEVHSGIAGWGSVEVVGRGVGRHPCLPGRLRPLHLARNRIRRYQVGKVGRRLAANGGGVGRTGVGEWRKGLYGCGVEERTPHVAKRGGGRRRVVGAGECEKAVVEGVGRSKWKVEGGGAVVVVGRKSGEEEEMEREVEVKGNGWVGERVLGVVGRLGSVGLECRLGLLRGWVGVGGVLERVVVDREESGESVVCKRCGCMLCPLESMVQMGRSFVLPFCIPGNVMGLSFFRADGNRIDIFRNVMDPRIPESSLSPSMRSVRTAIKSRATQADPHNIRPFHMPSAANTWVPNSVWSPGHCPRCHTHIGWLYSRIDRAAFPEPDWPFIDDAGAVRSLPEEPPHPQMPFPHIVGLIQDAIRMQ